MDATRFYDGRIEWKRLKTLAPALAIAQRLVPRGPRLPRPPRRLLAERGLKTSIELMSTARAPRTCCCALHAPQMICELPCFPGPKANHATGNTGCIVCVRPLKPILRFSYRATVFINTMFDASLARDLVRLTAVAQCAAGAAAPPRAACAGSAGTKRALETSNHQNKIVEYDMV